MEEKESGGILSFLFPGEAKTGDIKDYRARYIHRIQVEGEGLPPEAREQLGDGTLWDMTIEVTMDPPARHIVMRGLFAAFGALFTGGASSEEEPVFEMIQVENSTWVKAGDEWMFFTEAESFDPQSELETLKDFLTGGGEWQRVGTETVNGFQTTHYRMDVSSSEITGMSLLDLFSQFGVSETDVEFAPEGVTADVYVTDDGLLVKAIYTTTWKGEKEGQEVRVTEELSFEIEGVNLGITIEAPATAEVEEVVPLPEGAVRTGIIMGMRTYEVTGMSPDDVVAFYEEALPANGFTVESKFTQPGSGGMISASKEGTGYTILISPSDEKENTVNITIMEEGQ